MRKKRSAGVIILAAVLLLFAIFPVIILSRAFISPDFNVSGGNTSMYFVIALALVFLSIGVLRLKNWARVICLWISYLWGLAVISIGFNNALDAGGAGTDVVILGVLFYVLIVFIPIILFLRHPQVKRQFS